MLRVHPHRAAALAALALAAALGLAGCKAAQASVTSATPDSSAPATTSAPSATPATSAPATPPPSPSPSKPPVSFLKLKLHSKGTTVTLLQQRLTALGYWVGKADGKFGDSTQQAVFALQKAAGISPSGTITTATQKALLAGTRPSARSKTGTLIEIDLKRDLIMFVTNGQVKYILNTSTGGGYTFMQDGQRNVAITPKGHFTTYRTVNGPDHGPLGLLWRPRYFTGGVAIHGDDYVPAHPVSHGCARISNEAIDWIWSAHLDPIGTKVWVY